MQHTYTAARGTAYGARAAKAHSARCHAQGQGLVRGGGYFIRVGVEVWVGVMVRRS